MLFIFDMGGVVTNTFQMDSIYKKLNMTKDDFFGICKQNDKDIWEYLQTGEITVKEFWKEFNQRISYLQRAALDGLVKIGDTIVLNSDNNFDNIPDVKTDLFRLYFHPTTNNKTVEIINNLKKNNRVVCGTNTIDSHWENHMERGDYAHFHQTYASNKISAAKPNPEFFKIIMEAEGVTDPSTVFFTDDKLENVKAAQSVGINAIQFTTAEELEAAWKKYY